MFNNQPDNSRWDGFDRGTVWADEDLTPVERVIGRMTSESGKRVTIREVIYADGDHEYNVEINDAIVFCDVNCRERAIRVARWWMDGCPR